MADVDIDPFSEHDKTDEQPDTGETIPFTPLIVTKTPGWKPDREKSFGGGKLSQPDSRNHLLKSCIM